MALPGRCRGEAISPPVAYSRHPRTVDRARGWLSGTPGRTRPARRASALAPAAPRCRCPWRARGPAAPSACRAVRAPGAGRTGTGPPLGWPASVHSTPRRRGAGTASASQARQAAPYRPRGVPLAIRRLASSSSLVALTPPRDAPLASNLARDLVGDPHDREKQDSHDADPSDGRPVNGVAQRHKCFGGVHRGALPRRRAETVYPVAHRTVAPSEFTRDVAKAPVPAPTAEPLARGDVLRRRSPDGLVLGFRPSSPACHRFIPACAGNPRSIRLAVDGMRVHPRVCGEPTPASHRRTASTGSSPRVRGTLCGPPSCDGASLETAARDGPRRRRPLRIATPLRRRRLIVPVAHDGLRHRPVPRGPWPIAAVILRWVSTRIATGLCIVSRAFRPARSAADRRQPGRCVARQALAARVDPYRPERPPRRAREAACAPSYGPDAPGRPTRTARTPNGAPRDTRTPHGPGTESGFPPPGPAISTLPSAPSTPPARPASPARPGLDGARSAGARSAGFLPAPGPRRA